MNSNTTQLPRALYRAANVRELDRLAIDAHGMTARGLMQCAGESAWRAARLRWPRATRLLIVCGSGNNGGDGYVVAECARQAGLEVVVLQLGDPDKMAGDALHFASRWRAASGSSQPLAEVDFSSFDLTVDAALGTGLQRDVVGDFATALSAINDSGVPIVAIDIPSGLHADSGAVLGVAARAALTVSFIGLKRGLFTGDGPQHSGVVVFDALGVPSRVYRDGPKPEANLLSGDDAAELLPARARNAHKGHFGHVLVIGGEQGFGGAASMASEAALRTGAGLVTVATRASHVSAIIARRPEIMARAVENPSDLGVALANASIIAIGPGLGTGTWGRRLFARALDADQAMVVDADALNALAEEPHKRDNWILTPHPGEAARLLRTDTPTIHRDRFAAARQIAEQYGGICILKGAGSIVSDATRAARVVRAGNPGMATGGMGDVLTGIVAGLAAQGLSLRSAAELGVWLHARAADIAADGGERGLLATDLFVPLRALVNPPDER